MNIKKHEGRAFPIAGSIGDLYQPGMLLRDYFAAAALQGMLADKSRSYPHHEYASDAYSIADAMITERTKGMESEE